MLRFAVLQAVSKIPERRALRDAGFARSSATRLIEPDSLRRIPKESVSQGRVRPIDLFLRLVIIFHPAIPHHALYSAVSAIRDSAGV